MAYVFLLNTHNILRWLVILSSLWALYRVWSGLVSRSEWAKQDRMSGVIFTSLLNLQLVIGLLLLFTGPMKAAFSNMSATMKDPVMRFFAVEHPFMMILAVIVAQAGFSLSKRAGTDRAKFLRAAICYTVATILIFASIPWPFMKAARPLLPSFLG